MNPAFASLAVQTYVLLSCVASLFSAFRDFRELFFRSAAAVDTENSVLIENAGFRSVREINPVSKFSRV